MFRWIGRDNGNGVDVDEKAKKPVRQHSRERKMGGPWLALSPVLERASAEPPTANWIDFAVVFACDGLLHNGKKLH